MQYHRSQYRYRGGWQRLIFKTSPDDEYRIASYEIWKGRFFWYGKISYYTHWMERYRSNWPFLGLSRKGVRSQIAKKLWKLRNDDRRYNESRESR